MTFESFLKFSVRLIFGCQHKWVIIKEGATTYNGELVGQYYFLQCEKCGELTKRLLTP
jgi:hypothetical protein